MGLQKEILPLTSLRGLAAMAVIAMHFSSTLQPLAARDFPSLAPHGELAVDLFFILSGFIMAYTYRAPFDDANGWEAYKQFLGKRAARILPLNIAIATLFMVAALISVQVSGENVLPRVNDATFFNWLANALLMPGIGIGNSMNWPAWSISVEFLAYLFFPIFLLAVFHFWFALSIIGAVLILTLVCITGKDLSPDGLHSTQFLPWRDIGRCFSEFVLGIATYRVYHSRKYQSLFRRDDLAAVILAAILSVLLLKLGDLFAVLFFPSLILCISLNDQRLAKLMAMRFPYFLGLI